MDGQTRNQDSEPVSGIRYNMRGRGQPSETSLRNVGMRRTWGVPSGLPSEVRKVGLSTPRPFNPPSRTALRLVVLIANGTSDFASERSLRWELSPVNSPSGRKIAIFQRNIAVFQWWISNFAASPGCRHWVRSTPFGSGMVWIPSQADRHERPCPRLK